MALRLRQVELVARNLEGFTRDTPSITKELSCNGEFRVILAGAVDTQQLRRKIAWCEPRPGIKLKIVSFDAETGELWADVIPAE